MSMISVAADGSGDYMRVQDAVDSIPAGRTERTVIAVKSGVYKEKLFIDKPYVSLIGDGAERTVIAYGDHATKRFAYGEPYHTFNSYSAFIGGDDFTAEGLAFENTAGKGEDVGQALAAYVDADRAIFRHCRFVGCQDTLFTGPLPPAPRDRATFGGPREGAERRSVRQYYEHCYIEGDVDFIFGSATAVFAQCEIVSRGGGYVTAASTPEGVEFGYVFIGCRLTGDAPAQSVLLGRPWRNYAKVAFIDCWMGKHIAPEGWARWNNAESVLALGFVEYGNAGPGAPAASAEQRVSWSRQLTREEAQRFTVQRVLAVNGEWNPSENKGEEPS